MCDFSQKDIAEHVRVERQRIKEENYTTLKVTINFKFWYMFCVDYEVVSIKKNFCWLPCCLWSASFWAARESYIFSTGGSWQSVDLSCLQQHSLYAFYGIIAVERLLAVVTRWNYAWSHHQLFLLFLLSLWTSCYHTFYLLMDCGLTYKLINCATYVSMISSIFLTMEFLLGAYWESFCSPCPVPTLLGLGKQPGISSTDERG